MAVENVVSLSDHRQIHDFDLWCREAMPEWEAKWTAEKKVFTWLSKEPDYVRGSLSWFWLDDPSQPCTRIFRLSMIGGGQIRTRERWDWRRWPEGRQRATWGTWKDEHTVLWGTDPGDDVLVTTQVEGILHRYRGAVDGYQGECPADAAIFPRGTPQEVAGRTAATLASIGVVEENFYALLDSTQGCAICQRPLRDEISKLVGVGPECAKQHGIPHSIEAANRRLELRRTILGEEGVKH